MQRICSNNSHKESSSSTKKKTCWTPVDLQTLTSPLSSVWPLDSDLPSPLSDRWSLTSPPSSVGSCERGEPRGPPELPGGGGGAEGRRAGHAGPEGGPVPGRLPQGQAAPRLGVEEQAVQAHAHRLPARTWVREPESQRVSEWVKC